MFLNAKTDRQLFRSVISQLFSIKNLGTFNFCHLCPLYSSVLVSPCKSHRGILPANYTEAPFVCNLECCYSKLQDLVVLFYSSCLEKPATFQIVITMSYGIYIPVYSIGAFLYKYHQILFYFLHCSLSECYSFQVYLKWLTALWFHPKWAKNLYSIKNDTILIQLLDAPNTQAHKNTHLWSFFDSILKHTSSDLIKMPSRGHLDVSPLSLRKKTVVLGRHPPKTAWIDY